MSKRIAFVSKTGLKIALVALLLTALSTEALARGGSSGQGRDSGQGERGGHQGLMRLMRLSSSSRGSSLMSRGGASLRMDRDNDEEEREERNRVRPAVIQNNQDVIQKRIRLVAEPMATSSEINFRLEFPTEATTSNQLAQETLNRMQLSRDEIDRLLSVEQAAAADNFSTSLRGSEQVPAVATNASGTANFALERNDMQLAFTLNVTNLENATAAHIHRGLAGENGPIVANLFLGPTKTGLFSGVLAQGAIRVEDLVGPLADRPFADLVDLLRSGRAYVNVHTTQNPGGEIRGQIMAIAQNQPVDERINERLRVRADVGANMTNVRADFRFMVASTTRAQTIDGIFARLSALRLDDILNVLDLRIMAESGCKVIIDNDRSGPNRGRR